MKFDVTFLGTGQAVPTASRNHISIFVNSFNYGLLFDCGEGTQRQFRKAGVSLTKVDKVFISHWHGDHVLGLPGFIQTLSLAGHNRTVEFYGPKGTKDNISELLKVFPHHQKVKIVIHEVSKGIIFENDDFFVECSLMTHTVPCLAFSIVGKDKLRIDSAKLKKFNIPNSPLLGDIKAGKDVVINGKKVKSKSLTYAEPGKKLTIIFDSSPNDNAVRLAKNSTALICESTYGDNEEETALEYKHMTSRQAASIAKKSKSKILLLTHFSQRYEHKESILLDQACEVFKNTKLTNDLDKFEF
ncbi:MAG: ribonuclease Z [Nanoarchaeota archaeon]